MPHRVRFVYSASDYTTELAVRPWARSTRTVGGSRTAAGGVPASYVARRDRVLVLTPRVWEDEWSNIEEMVEWGQGSELITVYLDYPDFSVPVDCYLESPLAGSELSDNRSAEFPHILEPVLEFRRADGLVWDQQYFYQTDPES